MNKIKKLSLIEAQKIAAGEVVERPANVLKELLENALDAQATQITIYIQDGGKTCLRVVDNGCGMSASDALLCFEQHATSKITHVDELTSISTFGFRGEALASIAAVSKVTLITKEPDAALGTKIGIEGSAVIHNNIHHANTGTDIWVQDIFFNIPARKKFLKTTETEWNQIQQLFFAFCLAHPHIDFKLYNQDKLRYTCAPTTTLHERIAQLFEQKTALHMIPIAYTYQHITITGIASDHQFERYDRSMIYLFVNQRWIKDSTLTHAFIKGYQQVLGPGRYPAGCIYIQVNPLEVDINIHPRKEEVLFLHPRNVHRALTTAITQALDQKLSQQLQTTVQLQPSIPAPYAQSSGYNHTFKAFDFDTFFKQPVLPTTPTNTSKTTIHGYTQPEPIQPIHEARIPVSKNLQMPIHAIIGQYDATYILLQDQQGLLLIDQHAAHERVLFEQFCAQHGNPTTIQLMFAHTMHLNKTDVTTIAAYRDALSEYGIVVEPFGTETLKIQAMPLALKNASIDTIIKDILGHISECKELDQEAFNKQMQKKLYASMACKAAVKAGDTLTTVLMQELITSLYTTQHRFSCPHGRPTSYLLHKTEIEKKFKRDYPQSSD